MGESITEVTGDVRVYHSRRLKYSLSANLRIHEVRVQQLLETFEYFRA